MDKFKTIEHNKAIIPSIRLFALGHREFIDILSKNRGDLVSTMSCTHLINKRSFEVLEETIDKRFVALEQEEYDAIIMEVTVDRKSRLNKMYWIRCTPDSRRGLDMNRFLVLAGSMKQGKSIEQARLLSENNHFEQVLGSSDMVAKLLVSVSSSAEHMESNIESLWFGSNIEPVSPSNTRRYQNNEDIGFGSYKQTARMFPDKSAKPSGENNIEARLNKLVTTYKSAGFGADDQSSDMGAEELKPDMYSTHPATNDGYVSLRAIRTQRKMHFLKNQGTHDEEELEPVRSRPTADGHGDNTGHPYD